MDNNWPFVVPDTHAGDNQHQQDYRYHANQHLSTVLQPKGMLFIFFLWKSGTCIEYILESR